NDLFEQIYRQDAPYSDPAFNVIGWNSSYTGQPLSETAMREWVDQTVARIRGLHPRRVLEIGCGTGLLLFRIAPETSCYFATDFSSIVLDRIRNHVARLGLAQVELAQRLADDFF